MGGFPLNKILSLVEPKKDAKFLKFETFYDPEIAPGQKQKWYPWPYQEGITIEEAKNELSFLATGIYGKSCQIKMVLLYVLSCHGNMVLSQ